LVAARCVGAATGVELPPRSAQQVVDPVVEISHVLSLASGQNAVKTHRGSRTRLARLSFANNGAPIIKIPAGQAGRFVRLSTTGLDELHRLKEVPDDL
jgi:hypothetical protein